MSVNVIVAFWRALRTFLATLWRVTRQLFHEAAGTLFLLFAAGGAFSTWRYWKSRPAMPPIGTEFRDVVLAVMFTLMMAAFSVASFRSARRVR
ncbi:MAG TPA: hypothetical protein VJW51_02125 [Candidatus Acidoferrales bacterium]|nr:hypothetical protein [Candidatus Acidoferrales bacterium]